MALDFLSLLAKGGVGVLGPGGAWELLGKNILSANNLSAPAAPAASAANLGASPMAAMNRPKQNPAGFAIGTKILRGS